MAYWLFTEAIFNGTPIRVFNRGDIWRDFTYVDDVIKSTLAILDRPATQGDSSIGIYNVGGNHPEKLDRMIEILEELIGKKAIRYNESDQPGDIVRTQADVSRLEHALGFRPSITLEKGLHKFVDWYREYRGM